MKEYGRYANSQSISAKTLRKYLNLVPDEFTTRDLMEKLNDRKVLGKYSIKTISVRVQRMKNIGAIKIKEERPTRNGGNIWTKTELYSEKGNQI